MAQGTDCKHENKVTLYLRCYPGTRYDPPETEGKAQCNDCGDWMDLEDVPETAETREN